ncbi:MAG TPA: hypothetical protein VFP68_16140 [Burkholderiaceae bacterium]|nr:hypothetical protein [Burkholderiaceae bacterium]
MTEVEPVDLPKEEDDDDDDEGLRFGAGFYLKIAAVCIAGAIAFVILFRIFWRAVYAWGFFGGFLALGVLLLLFGWIYDRRDRRNRIASE